ncbi:tRNA uridine-5-carboxymethylaminomethyl(34) synthesis GTPase MnmE [Alistipes sp.]|uniref:tRNA uridine-5-carboxymethylaminomethyl(34) synthesis GTPase MnmE n=1 Tax=Alistipes sp. TaxID=1872444 RepID=UPI003AEF73C5
MIRDRDTIAAPATAPGGALAVIRLSGGEALTIADRIFRGAAPLSEAAGYTVHYGRIVEGEQTVDDVLVTVFRAPRSYTGEDAVEISAHGSPFIVSEILRLLIASGARMAEPGEFTLRAYLAGKLDLSQAEAVGDLIASSSRAAHALASNQMRGGYSEALEALRERLLHLASLLELELDFSEEEVEFADRSLLRDTMQEIGGRIDALRQSFSLGNAIKEGVAVALVGAPNVGKSTLLNRLLCEERALVSEIAGTTRDVIEERANIDGVVFRFLDTAGLRSTDDRLERMGIERTLASLRRARIVVCLLDAASLSPNALSVESPHPSDLSTDIPAGSAPAALTPAATAYTASCPVESAPVATVPAASAAGVSSPAVLPPTVLPPAATTNTASCSAGSSPASAVPAASAAGVSSPAASAPAACTVPAPDFPLHAAQTLLTVVNKIDTVPGLVLPAGVIAISAKRGDGIDRLREALRSAVPTDELYAGDAVVSNSRHYEALTAARESLDRALAGLRDGLPTDLLSEEVRQVIDRLGTITGRGVITPDEILTSLFSRFCIGK